MCTSVCVCVFRFCCFSSLCLLSLHQDVISVAAPVTSVAAVEPPRPPLRLGSHAQVGTHTSYSCLTQTQTHTKSSILCDHNLRGSSTSESPRRSVILEVLLECFVRSQTRTRATNRFRAMKTTHPCCHLSAESISGGGFQSHRAERRWMR